MRQRPGSALRRPLIVAALALVAVLPDAAFGQEVECDATKTEKEVRSLHFEGNRTFKDDALSARVLTTPSSLTRRYVKYFGAKRCYPDVGLKPDVEALTAFYKNNGFYDTRVDTIVKPVSARVVDITFHIEEGDPLRIDTLTITGLDSVPDPAKITEDLEMKTTQRFGFLLLYTDIDTIVSRLRNAGYPRADVYKGFRTHPDEHRAEVDLQVVTGARAKFGTIAVERTSARNRPGEIDSAVVIRLLGFQTGDWYSDRALGQAQRNLYSLGAYRNVGITIDTTAQPAESIVDVRVDLREDLMRQVDLEEGWATLDCFRVNALYTDKNFLDNAHRLELTGRVSKLGYGAPASTSWTRSNLCYRSILVGDSLASSKLNYYTGATIREPTLFGTHWVPSYSLYTERHGEYKAFLRTTQVGGQFSATRVIGLGMPLRFGYTFELGQTAAEPAVLCAQFSRCDEAARAEVQKKLRFAVASTSLQRIRIDNAVQPTRGYVLGGEVRGAAPAIGSDPSLRFFKTTLEGSWYHQLQSRVVLAARTRGGVIAGGAERGGAAKLPPPQERLYAGGATSVRGFQQNELGPLVYLIREADLDKVPVAGDSVFAYVTKPGTRAFRTVPVGGNALFEFGVELRIRDPFFPDLLEYVPFLDGGQVQQVGAHNLTPGSLNYTPGLGFRIFSPIGPIQLNLGYNPYGGRAGTAYFASPVNTTTSRAPLFCVTTPGETLVPITQKDGQLLQDVSACPQTFSPFQSSSFFKRLTPTLSIGTSF
jgi:outer membrane protein assembly complex protein YaeT